MKMKKVIFRLGGLLLATVLLSPCWAGAEPPSCPTAPVVMRGILQVGEFFGPPGYGEDPSADVLERVYYLQLAGDVFMDITAEHPSCAVGYFIQLVDSDFNKMPLKDKVGKKLKVTGMLFEGETGHHRTPVLLNLQKVEVISSWSEKAGKNATAK